MEIKYDGEISIATGVSRTDTRWKNRTWQWSELVQKLSETQRTHETVSEFNKLKKSDQDRIKDVGGFVGGYVKGGNRKASNIVSRQVLTLDLDFAQPDVWETFCLLYPCAACVYSTHKHTPTAPRLRLIIPLSREVFPEEYQAIARRVAYVIGIDMFDDTTYEPSRLMYWPSTPKDGEFLFEYQDGDWLDADSELATYKNWKDTSEWPVSSRVNDVITRSIKKQGDPLEKPGIVGAFCRTYDIHQTIEKFLSDEYTPCDVDNRYTYTRGSTAAGLVVYDDKFAYSHHGTDPTSGKLCNAFDLVRLHLYGDRDDNVSDRTNITKYPSYIAMEEFAAKDAAVKRLIFEEKRLSAMEDFNDVETSEERDNSWMENLDCNKKGVCEASRKNIRLILENDANISGCFAIDKFSNRAALLRLPVWRKDDDTDMFLRDDDVQNLRAYLESNWEIDSKAKIDDVLGIISRNNAFHPIKGYLDSLSWDGVNRVDTVFIDYLGVEDSELNRIATRVALTAAVTRIYSPGCEFDYTLVLVGEQGVGKSKLLAKLSKDRSWFTDGFSVEGKESYENLRGKWLVEIAELAGIKKADMDSVKKFLTKTSDFYRAAFEHYPQDQLRQCVFFGTTNNLNFLRDVTGDRRFWPMEVSADRIKKNQWTDLTDYEIDQIWAEAIRYYRAGTSLYLSKELEAEMNSRRAVYTEIDTRIGLVLDYLDTRLPVNWNTMNITQRRNFLGGDELSPEGTVVRNRVCIAEIWCECLRKPIGDLDRYNSNEIMSLMRKIEGWEWSVKTAYKVPLYGSCKCFIRKNGTDTAVDGTPAEKELIF